MNVSLLALLVFPGYLGVWIREFFWGYRGRTSAEKVLDASVLSLLSISVLAMAGWLPPGMAGFRVEDVAFSIDYFVAAFRVATVAVALSIASLILRLPMIVRILRRTLGRTLTHDVLYDKFLEVTAASAKETPEERLISLIRMKNGLFIRGVLTTLTDTHTDPGMFVESPSLYNSDLKPIKRSELSRNTSKNQVLSGSGLYIRRAEVDLVWLGVNELALARLQAERKVNSHTGPLEKPHNEDVAPDGATPRE